MIWLNPTVIPRNAKKMIIARPISSGCLPVLRPTYVMVRPATTSIHKRSRCFAFMSEYFHPIGKPSDGHQAQMCVKHQWVCPPDSPVASLIDEKRAVRDLFWVCGASGKNFKRPIQFTLTRAPIISRHFVIVFLDGSR